MFAFFGLGTQELLLLGVLGVGVAGVVAVVLYLGRSSGAPDNRLAHLEEENRRLREQLDRSKERPA